MARVEARQVTAAEYERLAREMEALFSYGLVGNAAVVAGQIAEALHQAVKLEARASQAEAALKEMQKLIDEFQQWLRDEAKHCDTWHSHAGAQLQSVLAELQRRRSRPTEET